MTKCLGGGKSAGLIKEVHILIKNIKGMITKEMEDEK